MYSACADCVEDKISNCYFASAKCRVGVLQGTRGLGVVLHGVFREEALQGE